MSTSLTRRSRPSHSQQTLEFSWPGKEDAQREAETPAGGKLAARVKDSLWYRTARDRLIEGENLAVLKLLEDELAGAVKMIYIDPPYNGGRDFIYRDSFGKERHAARRQQASAARHGAWLSMIYPRLAVARRLLADDGMIFVSIDDRELAHLTLVLDELFGEENRVGNLIWQGGRKNDSRLVSISHEYLVCYAHSRRHLADQRIRWHERKPGLDRIYAEYERLRQQHAGDHAAITDGMKAWYSSLSAEDPAKAHAHYCKSDARGLYFADNISWPGGGGPTYEVRHPTTGRPCRIPSRGWVFATPERMQQEIDDDRVEFGADETKVPTRKRYLAETEHQALGSVIYQDGRAASQRLRRMFGRKVFDHPKDERVLARLIAAVTSDDDLVLDFFAGSAATGHAVWLANRDDGAARRFVLVQQREPTGIDEYPTIADVANERLRRSAEAREGFRVYRHV